MADLNTTHCRCSTELVVRRGGITLCSHCDGPCLRPHECGFCARLKVICSSRHKHADAESCRKCEAMR